MIPPDQEPMPSRWDSSVDTESLGQIVGRITLLFLRAVIVPAGLASVLSLFASVWWLADLAVHFRLQYLLIGIIGLLPMLLLKRWWLSALAALCIALNFVPVAYYFQPAQARPVPTTASMVHHAVPPQLSATSLATPRRRPVRIASLNVFVLNSNFAGVVAWMQADQPDIVVLVEASKLWQQEMRQRATAWPYQHLISRPGRSGKLIMSRLPIAQIDLVDESPIRSPTPVATFALPGAPFRLAVIHTIWPMGEARTAARDHSLIGLRQIARTGELPLIAMGDFNISPFSPRFAPIVSDGVLRRATAGRGWLPTWPVFFPAAGIQIDHLLVTPTVAVDAVRTRSELGSDHRAVIADLQIPMTDSPAKRANQRQAATKRQKLLRAGNDFPAQ